MRSSSPSSLREVAAEPTRIIRCSPTGPAITRMSPAASSSTQALWQVESSRTQMVQSFSPMASPARIAASTWPPEESMSRMRLPMPRSVATLPTRSANAAKLASTLPL